MTTSPYFLKNFEYNPSRISNFLKKEKKPCEAVVTTTTTVTTVLKKKKDSIPKKVKEEVWNRYIGDDIPKHRCLCCKSNVIKMTDFQVGHVKSEKDGGTLAISNLRPICASCNFSMGTMNMIEYAIKYEFIIG
jgi:5-methylcytosine-specific restriction endonuclease McrA